MQLYSFFNLGARRWWVVNATVRPLYPRERPATHCIGGCVRPRAGLDRCAKSRRYRDPIPGPSSPQRDAIPTALSRGVYAENYMWFITIPKESYAFKFQNLIGLQNFVLTVRCPLFPCIFTLNKYRCLEDYKKKTELHIFAPCMSVYILS